MTDVVCVDRQKLPEEEHDAARSIETNLIRLQTLAEEFRHSVHLYIFAHDKKLAAPVGSPLSHQMRAWIQIACRNGAIVARSFSILMHAINSAKMPTIWQRANMHEREAATKLFATEFPAIEGVRQSAAHPGELSKSADEANKHRLKETLEGNQSYFGAGVFLEGHVCALNESATYTSSFKEKPVSYELSIRKADILDTVATHYCRAFHPTESEISRLQRERRRQFDEQLGQG